MTLKALLTLVALIAIPILATTHPKFYQELPAPSEEIADDGLTQLVEVAENILTILGNVVNTLAEEVIPNIQQMLQALEVIQSEAVRATKQVIEKEIQAVNQLTQELSDLTDVDTDKKTLKCMTENQKQVPQLRDEAVDYALTCISTVIQTVGNDTLELLSDIKLLNNKVLENEKDLKDCKDDDAPSDCVKNVINELVGLAITLPARGQQDADKADNDFEKLTTILQTCVKDAVTIVDEEGAQIYNNIKECLGDDKYPNSNDYYDDFQ